MDRLIQSVGLSLFWVVAILALPVNGQSSEQGFDTYANHLGDSGGVTDPLTAAAVLEQIENVSSWTDEDKNRCFRAILETGGGLVALDRRDRAVLLYQHAVKLFPREMIVGLNLGTLHLLDDRYEEAIGVFQEFLQGENSRIDRPERQTRAVLYNNLGKAYFASQRQEEAAQALLKALELDPQLTSASLILARVEHARDRKEECIAILESALPKGSSDVSYDDYSFLASLYQERKDHQDARRVLEDARQRFPLVGGLYLSLAEVYFDLGLYAEAVYACVMETFQSGPEGEWTQKANQNISALRKKVDEDALYPRRQELQALFSARDRLKNGDIQGAVEILDQLSSGPARKTAPVLVLLGEALTRAGMRAEAIDTFLRVVNLEPEFAPAYCIIGDIYESASKGAEAVSWWQKGIEVDPKNWKSRETLRKIARLREEASNQADSMDSTETDPASTEDRR